MSAQHLRFLERPELDDACMIVGLAGWMDGGEVSTGVVDYLGKQLDLTPIAEIESDPFYIFNSPGSMEVTSLFRPHTEIKDGLITSYATPQNAFFCDPANRLILMEGEEPNLLWQAYTDCVFEVATVTKVKRIYFLGSYAGASPHTREPRIHASVSHPELKETLTPRGIRFSNYEGPAGIVTHLTREAARHDIRMASLVVEIPAYLQGRNPLCIEAMLRCVMRLLNLRIDLRPLRAESREFESGVSRMVNQEEALAEMVHKLEIDYDSEAKPTDVAELQRWMEDQGFAIQ